MTAAELASFRALLQAQAPPPPRPDRGLFARMRARLTVVERTEPPAGEPLRPRPAAPPKLHAVTWDEAEHPAPADPPPSRPPVFGRREAEPDPEPAAAPPKGAAPNPEPSPELVAVRLRRRAHVEESCSTPDDLDRPVTSWTAPPPSPDRPAPGVIAGWSRTRPPSAQRRILQRLQAVIAAERQGLDARIAADTPAG